MTAAELIVELQKLPPDIEIVAGEWVSPSQLGKPVVEVKPDYCSPTPRAHVWAPRAESFEDDDV